MQLMVIENEMRLADWRRALAEPRRRHVRIWFWSIAAVTLAVLVVGGITRLTLSGLSMVEWQPLLGVIPPLTEAQWLEKFEQYRRFPDFDWRSGMTLSEFKFIFFWEYLHRLLARLIGFVFLVPFAWFGMRGYFNRALLTRSLMLFGLGALQGVLGWLMVMSGLVDRPSVSHYRLAAHLSLAFIIAGYAVWLARELSVREPRVSEAAEKRLLLRGLTVVGVVLCTQVVWGAFVAGLRAGKYYPTFPLMGGRLVPAGMLQLEGVTRNFFENPVTVQWLHRVIGTVLLVLIATLAARVRRSISDPVSRRLGMTLLGVACLQYLLGILTLINMVPVNLGVMHQAVALMLFGTWVWWLHHARNLEVS
jgi:heme a synthase